MTGFVDVLCDRRRRLRFLLAVCLALFVVLLAPLSVVEPGSSTYVITVFQLVTLGPLVLVLGGILVACRRRESDDESRH